MKLANRVQNIKPSATLAITAKVKSMVSQGIDVVGFGAGEPDFDTPQNIKDVGISAIQKGFTKYCPVGGTDDLKDAIIEKLRIENGLEYDKSQIIVSCGAKHSIYNIMQAILDKGDEVIIPSPYWVSYPDMTILASAKPKIVKTKEKDGFKMTPDALNKTITKRSRVVIINSPSNPTGACYTKEELTALGEIILKNDLMVISDDIYEKLVYDGFKFYTIASLSKELKDRTFVVNGVSKAYSMTGWRIGYTAGLKEVISAMTNIQGQSTSNPTSISLKASVEALKGPQDSVEMMRKEFEKRRDYIVERLNSLEKVKCFKPVGAFYVFPNISKLFGKTYKDKVIDTSTEFANFLLDSVNVAVVPGVEFGDDRYIRLSYATSMENIKKGLDRIQDALLVLQ